MATPAETKKTNWVETFSYVVITIATVYQAVQGAIISTLVLLGFLILFTYPIFIRQWKKWKFDRKRKEALTRFTTDFLSYVDRAETFIQSTNQYGIPYYLRSVLLRIENKNKFLSYFLENFFSRVLWNCHSRIKKGFNSYSEFDEMAKEFYDIMDSFVLIYVNEAINELKKPENLGLLLPQEISQLKVRYSAFNQFVNEYNGFRSRISKFLENESTTFEIRIPTETLD